MNRYHILPITAAIHLLLCLSAEALQNASPQGKTTNAELAAIQKRLCTFADSKGYIKPSECVQYNAYHPTEKHTYANFLSMAILAHDTPAIAFFCGNYPDCVNEYNCYGEVPLHVALCEQYDDAIATLLNAGANPHQFSVVYTHGAHPRDHSHCPGTVHRFMEMHQYQIGSTWALELAVQQCDVKRTYALLQKGANPNYVGDNLLAPGILQRATRYALKLPLAHNREQAQEMVRILLQHGAGSNQETLLTAPLSSTCGAALLVDSSLDIRDENTKIVHPGICDLSHALLLLFNHHKTKRNNISRDYTILTHLFQEHAWSDEDINASLYFNLCRGINSDFITFLGNILLNGKKMRCSTYKHLSLVNVAIEENCISFLKELLAWGACPNTPDAQKKYPLECVQQCIIRDGKVVQELHKEDFYKVLIEHGAYMWNKGKDKYTDRCIHQYLKLNQKVLASSCLCPACSSVSNDSALTEPSIQ